MSSEPLPQKAQASVARQETKKEDPGSSSPQSHDRRPVRVSGDTGSHTPPHQSVLGSSQRCSAKTRPRPPLLLLPVSFGPGSQAQGEEQGEEEPTELAPRPAVGVTVTAGPSECGLEVGVQDGFSIWRLDVIGGFLKLQQHGHQRV